MQKTDHRNAASAAILALAVRSSAGAALGDGGGDPSPIILITPRGANQFHNPVIQESLTRARALFPFAPNGPTRAVDRPFPIRLNDGSFTPRLFRKYNNQLLLPLPAFGGDSPNLTPLTGSTPEPTASAGNCGQPANNCADDETQRRKARKAETKRAQREFAAWAQQKGFAR